MSSNLPAPVPERDPVRPFLGAATCFTIYWVLWNLLIPPARFLGGEMVADTLPLLVSATIASAFGMAIFESRALGDIGLHWRETASFRNLLTGLALGIAGAALLILPCIALGFARYQRFPEADVSWSGSLVAPVLLLCGAAGEEIIFRGFMLQYLMRGYGPWAGIPRHRRRLRTSSRRQSRSHHSRHRQHSRLRHSFRSRSTPHPRPLVPHRDPLRMERNPALPRRRPQRPYNQSYGVSTGMERIGSLEWRKVRTRSGYSRLGSPPDSRSCVMESTPYPRLDLAARQQRCRLAAVAGRSCSAFLIALLALQSAPAGVLHPADKLTEDEKLALVRDLSSEYAKVKGNLPRSHKALEFNADGTWNLKQWQEAQLANGLVARLGDQIQITKVTLDGDKILFDINGGLKGPKGGWKNHVQVGVGVGMVQQPLAGAGPATVGTTIELNFHKPMEGLTSDEVKSLLSPIFDFDKHTATRLYSETLSPEVSKAVAEKRALVGMDREQVILALGHPDHKYRESKDGVDSEDWIFGIPPGKITFVTFEGAKVTKVKDQYAGLGIQAATPKPVP